MFFFSSFIPSIKPFIIFEPTYLLFNLASGISMPTDVNLYLQKMCRHNVTFEPDIRTPCDDERAAIDFVATVNSKYKFSGSFITLIIAILMSAWTDKAIARRKFCILFPMVLKLLQLIVMCFHSYFWYWPVLYAVLTEVVLSPTILVRVASIIYICTITAAEDRTLRLRFLSILLMLSNIISSGSSGFLMRNLGFLYTYILCAILTSAAIIYGALFIENVATESSPGLAKNIRNFFDVGSVTQAFKLVFRKRSGNERTIVCLLSMINVLALATYIGEFSLLYLYLRHKFGWNEQDYGIYMLYKMVGISIGTVFCIGLRKYFKVTDSAVGTFVAFWDILAALSYFFATENWQLYLIPILDVFHGLTISVCQSLQSKFFENHEFGRLFSVHISLDVLLPFAYLSYNLLFKSTLDSMPGSIFLLSGAINSVIFFLYGLCYMFMRTLPKTE